MDGNSLFVNLNKTPNKKMKKKPKEKIEDKKKRNAGIDLLRILGMIDIILFHILQNSMIFTKYAQYKKQLNIFYVFTNWHISMFGIISGVVGYKTHKYSNLMHLWIIVVFYSLSIHYGYKKYNQAFSTENKLEQYLFPVIYNNHWYFSSYFGMYLFLPIINKGIIYLNKREFTIIVFIIIIIFKLWHDYMAINDDVFRMNSGRSIISLTIFYIIGAYLGKFIIKDKIKNKFKNIVCCLLYIMLFFFSGYASYYYINVYHGTNKYEYFLKKIFNFNINSFGAICQSICLLLFFSRIKYNKYLGKIISFIGQLTFAVYIMHDHIDIRFVIYRNMFAKYSNNLSLSSVIKVIIYKTLQVFTICIIIDCFRYLLFKLLRIKTICISIEKGIFLIVNKCIKMDYNTI